MTSHNQDNCPICQSLQPLLVEVTYHDGYQTVDPSQPAEITSVTIWSRGLKAELCYAVFVGGPFDGRVDLVRHPDAEPLNSPPRDRLPGCSESTYEARRVNGQIEKDEQGRIILYFLRTDPADPPA